jgi:hypothetical protein
VDLYFIVRTVTLPLKHCYYYYYVDRSAIIKRPHLIDRFIFLKEVDRNYDLVKAVARR